MLPRPVDHVVEVDLEASLKLCCVRVVNWTKYVEEDTITFGSRPSLRGLRVAAIPLVHGQELSDEIHKIRETPVGLGSNRVNFLRRQWPRRDSMLLQHVRKIG